MEHKRVLIGMSGGVDSAAAAVLLQQAGYEAFLIDNTIAALSDNGLLNDEYYEFMLSGRKVVNEVGVLSAECLIPFKMRAWIDLNRRKSEGEHVNSDDIKKHKNDVFRLMNIINPDETVSAPEVVKADIREFVIKMPQERINLKNIGLDMELEDALQVLKDVYGV